MDYKAFSLINIIRNIVAVYLDIFFAIYFLHSFNYQIYPFAIFYLIVYVVVILAFWFLSSSSRLKYKIYYYRIGIALTALYVALLFIMQDDFINHLYLLAVIRGLGDGFYFYPRNIFNSSKIANRAQKKYSSLMLSINNISAIIVPLVLGVTLNFFSYSNVSIVIFLLLIIIFILSFYVKDDSKTKERINLFRFYRKIKKDNLLQRALIMQFLQGFTISGGLLVGVMTIYKILYFESNLYIGILNSLLGILACVTSVIYLNIKKEKYFKPMSVIILVLMSICLVILGIDYNNIMFIIYLIIYAIGVTLINMTTDQIIVNASNQMLVKLHRAEYHLFLELLLELARIIGIILLLSVGITENIKLLNCLLFFSIIPFTVLIIYVIGAKNKDVKCE